MDLAKLSEPIERTRELIAQFKLRAMTGRRSDVAIRGRLWLHGGGKLVVGKEVTLNGGREGIEIYVRPGGVLTIGDGVSVAPGTSIEAYTRVDIGSGCRIGAFCKLLDNNLHSLSGVRHNAPQSSPIVLEEGVVVDDYVVLLPGARIERGAVIGSGAVVSRRVPAGAKVPARSIHPSRRM